MGVLALVPCPHVSLPSGRLKACAPSFCVSCDSRAAWTLRSNCWGPLHLQGSSGWAGLWAMTTQQYRMLLLGRSLGQLLLLA